MEQPDTRPVKESGDLYRVYQDYYFFIGSLQFKIPEGFRFDGGSVPKALWSIIGLSRDGMPRAAYLIHDFMYVRRGRLMSVDGIPFHYDRKFADKRFKRNLIELGIKSPHVKLAYMATRVFGGSYWDD